jgi:hypothetical protein
MKLEFTEFALDHRTTVRTKFYIARPCEIEKILVIEFASPVEILRIDISYMLGLTFAANEIFLPSGIIYDCRQLRYTWGDTMTTLFSPLPTECPSELLAPAFSKHVIPKAFVVSELCRPGLTSLCTAEMQIDPTKFLFDTLDHASANILQQLRSPE